MKTWYNEYKRTLQCEDCDISGKDTCLSFHHEVRRKKDAPMICYLIKNKSKAEVLEAIEECTPLCKSCHGLRHSDEIRGRNNEKSIKKRKEENDYRTERRRLRNRLFRRAKCNV